MQLTATIAPASDILSRLAGEEAEVTTLLPQGASPENYEPTTQDIRDLSESKGFFYVGDLGFERSSIAWMQASRQRPLGTATGLMASSTTRTTGPVCAGCVLWRA